MLLFDDDAKRKVYESEKIFRARHHERFLIETTNKFQSSKFSRMLASAVGENSRKERESERV